MAADGSIVISAKMNVGQAEKDLAKLKSKIEKTENDIAAITKKRDAASEKGALGAEQLEKERQKLQEMKKSLEELKASAKEAKKATSGGSIADTQNQIAQLTRQRSEANQQRGVLGGQLDEEKRRLEELKASLVDLKTEYSDLKTRANDKFLRRLNPVEADKAKEQAAEQAARITQQNEEIKEQQRLVNALQKEFDRVDSSVDKYSQKLQVATYKLEQQKESAASSTASASAAEQIPAMQVAVQEQQQKVNALQSEWNKTHNSVERYNQQLADANTKLDQQKAEAGQLSDNIEAAKKSQGGINAAVAAAGDFTDKLGERIKRLASRVFVFTLITQALRSLRTWFGNVINTNDEARAAIARLQGALLTMAQPLVQVIIPAFTAFVNILAAVVSRIAQFISMIFGTTIEKSAQAAKSLNKQAQGYGNVAKAAEEAAGSLAGFDEINTIQTETPAVDSGSGGGASGIVPDFEFLDGVTDDLKKIADLVLLIASGFALWTIGAKIAEKGGALGEILKILGGAILIASGLYIMIDNIKAILDGKYKNVSKESFIKTVLGGALVGLGLVAMGAGAWIIPIAIGLAFAITDIVVNWDSIKSMWESALDGIGALFTGDIDTFWQKVSEAFLTWTGMDAWSVKISEWIADAIWGEGTYQNAINYLQNGGSMEAVFAFMMQKIQEAFSGIGNWFSENVITPVVDKFSSIKDVIPAFFASAFENIKSIWNNAPNWFASVVGEPIKQIFNAITNYMNNIFAGNWASAWNNVKEIFRGVWNYIISVLEAAVNLIAGGINWITSSISSALSFDVPGIFGGGHIGLSIPQIGRVSIPRLAQGAVIPPNREFMAVLGDQRQGTNVEAPLKTIEQAVENVLGRSNYGGDIHVTLELDGKVVTRTVVKNINQMAKSSTKPVLAL